MCVQGSGQRSALAVLPTPLVVSCAGGMNRAKAPDTWFLLLALWKWQLGFLVFLYLFLIYIYINLFILFLAALGFHCCAWAFSSYGEQGILLVVVRGLLIVVASLVAEHGL